MSTTLSHLPNDHVLNFCSGLRDIFVSEPSWTIGQRFHRSSLRRLGLIAIIFVCGIFSFDLSATCQELPREAIVCGPNALLMYLTMRGGQIEDEVIDSMHCGKDGASMKDLCDEANALGFPSEVRHYQSSELRKIPIPAIVQSRRPDGRHHFFVVYRSRTDGLIALDGTTAESFRVPISRFNSFLTGYAVVPADSHFLDSSILSDPYAKTVLWGSAATMAIGLVVAGCRNCFFPDNALSACEPCTLKEEKC